MKLTAAKRKALPTSKFAGPDRSYPVDTKARAANAKARSTQAVQAGRMSPSTKAKIDAAANKKLNPHHGRTHEPTTEVKSHAHFMKMGS